MNMSSFLTWLILAALPVGSDQYDAGASLQEKLEPASSLFDNRKEGFHEEEKDHFDDEEKDEHEMVSFKYQFFNKPSFLSTFQHAHYVLCPVFQRHLCGCLESIKRQHPFRQE